MRTEGDDEDDEWFFVGVNYRSDGDGDLVDRRVGTDGDGYYESAAIDADSDDYYDSAVIDADSESCRDAEEFFAESDGDVSESGRAGPAGDRPHESPGTDSDSGDTV